MVSYASARAESLIPKCDVGFLRRPERVVLFIIGALSTHPGSTNFFANRMPAVLWVLAIGSYWTFAHRMYHTWRELNTGSLPTDTTQESVNEDDRRNEKAKSAIGNRQLEIN
jgi:CDP-diacylglycerol--glycerol-3-phosphate 3-phosphatidyltransferase